MRYEKLDFSSMDEIVNSHDTSLTDLMTNGDGFTYTAGGGVTITGEKTIFGTTIAEASLNDNGFGNLCYYLGVPKKWLQSEKCPSDLEEYVVNRLKTDMSDNRLWRLRKVGASNVCRAVLSEQYLKYNHKHMWDDIKESIVGTGMEQLKPKIWKPYVQDSMNFWILFENVTLPDNEKLNGLYDGGGTGGLRPAIHIRNSEDGTGRAKIMSGMYRSYCDNGVIFGWTGQAEMEAVHRGNNFGLMRTKVALAIAEAADNCGLGIERFVEATHIRIKQEAMNKVVENWTQRYSISIEASEGWNNALKNTKTWADVVMATSDYANSIENGKKQSEFEEIAGQMLFEGVSREYTY